MVFTTLKVGKGGSRSGKSLRDLKVDRNLSKNQKPIRCETEKAWATNVKFKHDLKLGDLCQSDRFSCYDLLATHLLHQGHKANQQVKAGDNGSGTCAVMIDSTEYRLHKYLIYERTVKES